jgi:hypothetical protein
MKYFEVNCKKRGLLWDGLSELQKRGLLGKGRSGMDLRRRPQPQPSQSQQSQSQPSQPQPLWQRHGLAAEVMKPIVHCLLVVGEQSHVMHRTTIPRDVNR